MFNFTVNFAGLNIGITSIYKYTMDFCKDYIVDEPAVFSVCATEDKINHEIEISDFNPPAPYAESICIYREIAERLPLYNRFIFHGASISFDGDGYIFTAPSGTGKSTHILLWQKYLGTGVEVVNGDKPIIEFTDNGAIIHSTPYAGKEGLQNHSSVPLKAVCIVGRGLVNSIEKIRVGAYFNQLFKQVYNPVDTKAAAATIQLFNRLAEIPFYSLKCDISEQAVRTSFEKLSGKCYDEYKK